MSKGRAVRVEQGLVRAVTVGKGGAFRVEQG